MGNAWVLLLGAVLVAAAGADVVVDRMGQLSAVGIGGEYRDLNVQLVIPMRGWSPMVRQSQARDVKVTREGNRTTWTGRLVLPGEVSVRYAQVLTEAADGLTLDYQVVPEGTAEVEGVFLWLDVPIAAYRGAPATLSAGDWAVATAEMPREQPAARHFVRGEADRVVLGPSAAGDRVTLTFDRALPVTVQDTREWRGTHYSLFTPFALTLTPGQPVSLSAKLLVEGRPDRSPANLTVDLAQVRYRLHGFGGNYCFGVESPTTQYTLANLRSAWARTEMTPALWEPENDNDDPRTTNWDALIARDQPNSELRHEFEVARQIQQKGIPWIISIWYLPKWLYEEPPAQGNRQSRRRIAPDQWDELLECLGTYLEYAKRQYGVEPDLFSFNEANIGVDVLLTAEEHRDAIKRIGADFERRGLKTRMLLADATGPRGTHTYALPAAEDPEAMRYVGAVAFHSWGGASAAEYNAWAELAERLRLPLVVAEAGPDASAWQGASYKTFHYALRELQHYQELLLHARPQSVLLWEFTSDYGLLDTVTGPYGQPKLSETPRYWFHAHWCNLTPLDADALGTSSDSEQVLMTAFRGENGGPLVLHLSNLGAERPATVSGLPAGLTRLRVIHSGAEAGLVEGEPVAVNNGTARLTLPSQSLVTLTTAAR